MKILSIISGTLAVFFIIICISAIRSTYLRKKGEKLIKSKKALVRKNTKAGKSPYVYYPHGVKKPSVIVWAKNLIEADKIFNTNKKLGKYGK